MAAGNYARTSHKPYEGEMFTDEQLANILPEGMHWGDPLTPALLLEILSHVRVVDTRED